MKRRHTLTLWSLTALCALWLGACAMSFPIGQSTTQQSATQQSAAQQSNAASPEPSSLLLTLLQEPTPTKQGADGPRPVLECYAGAFLGSPDAGASLPVVASSCWQPLLRLQVSGQAVAYTPNAFPGRP